MDGKRGPGHARFTPSILLRSLPSGNGLLGHGQRGVVSHFEEEPAEAGRGVRRDERDDAPSERGGGAASGIVCVDQFGYSR